MYVNGERKIVLIPVIVAVSSYLPSLLYLYGRVPDPTRDFPQPVWVRDRGRETTTAQGRRGCAVAAGGVARGREIRSQKSRLPEGSRKQYMFLLNSFSSHDYNIYNLGTQPPPSWA